VFIINTRRDEIQAAKGRMITGLARPYRGLGIHQPKAIETLHRSVLPSDVVSLCILFHIYLYMDMYTRMYRCVCIHIYINIYLF